MTLQGIPVFSNLIGFWKRKANQISENSNLVQHFVEPWTLIRNTGLDFEITQISYEISVYCFYVYIYTLICLFRMYLAYEC